MTSLEIHLKKMNTGVKNLVQTTTKTLSLTLVLLILFSCGNSSTNSVDDNRILEAEISLMKVHFPDVQTKYSWPSWYGESLYRYLNERSELTSILDVNISSYDLKLLKCSSYNYASAYEKKRFLILFIASIAHAESNLNPNTTFREKDGTLSSGLLQIDLASANRHSLIYTGFQFTQRDLFNPDLNLMAGLYILKHQLEGGMNGERPEIRGRLFTNSSYYWSVLTLKKEMIIKTFTQNARANLPFCSIGG